MKNRFVLILALSLALLSCYSAREAKNAQKDDALKEIQQRATAPNFAVTELICDTIYENKKYKIIVSTFTDAISYDQDVYNAVFKCYTWNNERYQEIYSDSIQQHFSGIEFLDFNNDGVKDILLQNTSDARSNLTYYLYLVATKTDQLQKIKKFETIKNPHYLPEHDIIDNLVLSGRNWTNFYKIEGDSIIALDTVIYEGTDENGADTYDKDYQTALKKLTQKN